MFIDATLKSSRRGFTFVEMLIAMGLSVLIISAVMSSFIFCTKSMMTVSNYDKMNQSDQLAVDKITKEIRGLGGLTNYSAVGYTNSAYPGVTAITNSTTYYPVNAVSSNTWITYSYDPVAQTLTRSQSGTNQIYLTNCAYLNFALFQRNQTNGTFLPLPTTNVAMVKIIQVAWSCSQPNSTLASQTDSVKSTEVVIRCK